MTPTGCLLCEGFETYMGKDCPACQTITSKTTQPKTAGTSPTAHSPRQIELGRYAVVLHPSGRRELRAKGKIWLDAQPNTIVWELIDKIISLSPDMRPPNV